MAELTGAITYPGTRRQPGANGDDPRVSYGRLSGLRNASGFSYPSDAVITVDGHGVYTIPANTGLYIWQGSQAATDATRAYQMDLTTKRWRVFYLPGASRLYACAEQDYAVLAAANDVLRVEYQNHAGMWRRSQRKKPAPAGCLVGPVPTLIAGRPYDRRAETPHIDGPLGTNTLDQVQAMAVDPTDGSLWWIQLDTPGGGPPLFDKYQQIRPGTRWTDPSTSLGTQARLRRVDHDGGTVTTIDPTLHSTFSFPYVNQGAGMAFAAGGDLYYSLGFYASSIVGANHYRTAYGQVFKRRPDGTTTLVAGQAVASSSGSYVPLPGLPAAATSFYLSPAPQLALLDADTLLLADYTEMRIYALTLSTGQIAAFAGNGLRPDWGDGTQDADSGPAASLAIGYPVDMALDTGGTLYVLTAADAVYTVAGGAAQAVTDHVAYTTAPGPHVDDGLPRRTGAFTGWQAVGSPVLTTHLARTDVPALPADCLAIEIDPCGNVAISSPATSLGWFRGGLMVNAGTSAFAAGLITRRTAGGLYGYDASVPGLFSFAG